MNLFYRKEGNGHPVIILHGLFGMSDNWMSIARKISKKHTVYIIDQRNHGRSEHDDVFNYDVLLDDLNAFIIKHKLERPKLIGHSMGGKVVMRYALNFPEKIERVVVVDIAPKTYYHTHFETFFEALFKVDLNNIKSRTDADNVLHQFIHNTAIRQFLLKNLYRDKSNQFSWKINLKGIYENMNKIMAGLQDVRQFDGPALFVRGGQSDYVLDGDFSLIYKWFPNARIETIAKATHWLHADAPDEFCDSIRPFFEQSQ